jgi:hypothetical protein
MNRTIEQERDREVLKNKVMIELAHHVGKQNAIGMAELFEVVFGEPWAHRINDTRDLREIITDLRDEGTPICSAVGTSGGGYYLAAAKSELADYLGAQERKALKILSRNSRMRRITLPDYLGQIRVSMGAVDELS